MTAPPTRTSAGPGPRPHRRARWTLVVLGSLAASCGGSGEPEAPAPAPGAAGQGSTPTPSAPSAAGPGSAPAGIAETAPRGSAPRILLQDEARERGLDYVNRSGEPGKPTILEANGAGVALLDLGNDGDLDVVFSQGLGSLGALLSGPGADLEVFLNDGRGRFSRAAGPGLSGWWTGLATGDVDGDGDDDLVAGGFGALELLLQGADGRLAPAPRSDLIEPASGARGAKLTAGGPREAGAEFPAWATSLALADFDRDGRLDLFVGQYVGLDPAAPPLGKVGEGSLAVPCRWKGQSVFCGPHGLPRQSNRLLFGRGDGSFEDRTSTALAGQVPGYTLGLAVFDADGDLDSDVYVANDSVANCLWINDGSGRFRDFAYAANVALSMDGAAEAGMGVAVGDVNQDGAFDFALTNFSGEPTELFFGAPRGFDNRTHRMGLGRETLALLSWSVHLFDVDQDGRLELFTSNGHVYPQADAPGTGTSYGQAATLWRIPAEGRVESVAPEGPNSLLAPPLGARGSAVGDLDGDGDLDLVLARIDGPAALGINRTEAAGHGLSVRCLGPETAAEKGPRTPRDGRGARLILTGKDGRTRQMSEVQTAQGYQSASTPWIHFGLGRDEEYGNLEVLWPSGSREQLGPGRAGRRLTLREGAGLVGEEPFQ